MPSIRLRSAQNTLLSACDHPTDRPSIRLLSVAIALLLCPHTPGGSQAPLSALGGRALPRSEREEGKRRLEGPRHRHECDNARSLEVCGPDGRLHAANLGEHAVLGSKPAALTVIGSHNLLPGASHRDNRVTQGLKLLRFPPLARCVQVTGILATCEALAKLSSRRDSRSAPWVPFQIEGGGGESRGRPILDLFTRFRGGLQKNRAARLEKFGSPIFPRPGFEIR